MKEAQIYIVGTIGNLPNETDGVTLEDVITQVNANRDADKYVVKIKSPGGDYDLGFDIYKYLKSLGKPVDTVAMGQVASIASVIFMAGQNRIMLPESSILIHNPWTSPQGAYEASDLQSLAKWMQEAENNLLTFYAKETNNTKEAIQPLMKVETVLTPQRSKDLGFATEVKVDIPVAHAFINKPVTNLNTNKMSKENKTFMEKLVALINNEKPEVKNLLVNVADGQLDFYELPNDQTVIPVGAKATFNGEPAQGEYIDQADRVFVFDNEVLQEIRMPEEEGTDDVDMEAMKKDILEAVATLMENEVSALAKKSEELEKRFAERDQIFAGLKGLIGKEVEDKKANPYKQVEVDNEDKGNSIFSMGFAKHNKN